MAEQSLQQQLYLLYPKVVSVSYEVELTDEEIAEAMNEAKLKKQIRQEHERKVQWRRDMESEAARPWGPREQWENAKRIAQSAKTEYVIDDELKDVFTQLCFYFTRDSRFAGDLNKGIMLVGNVGVGKSLLMYAFSRNKRQCFEVLSSRRVTDEFCEDGIEVIKKYFTSGKALLGTFEYFMQKEVGYCFDDLGTEDSPSTHYKNTMNVMEKVILNRYDAHMPFHLTHFTTNLKPDDIEKKYGSRARSRLREMVNFIELPGEDRRQ